jgi:site-specific DNA recombinase
LPLNAVIYCRVSTKEQVHNLSLAIQQTRCVDHCTGNGWTVAKVFRDEGESAKTTDRTKFKEMLAFCKTKQNAVDFVVVHDLSRFSRRMEDQVSVIADLEDAGVRLRSVSENVDETSAGKLMRNIHGAINQFDNDRKAERTRLGMQRAASMGRFPFKAPLGYLNVGSQKGANLIHDPERGPLIRKAFELYATGGDSKAKVLRTITGLGLKTQRGLSLTAQTFEKLLRNPIYCGWVVIPTWSIRERGSFSPLISEELFGRVQDILDGKRLSVATHNRNNPDFPLRVFVSCGECKTPLTGSWSKGRNSRYPYYRCRNSGCRAVNVRRDVLEKEFASLLERLAPEMRYMRLFKEIVRQVWKQKISTSEGVLRVAKSKLADLETRKNQLVDFLLNGRLDQKTYEEQTERLRRQVESAEKDLREADMQQLDVEAVLGFAEKLVHQPQKLWLQSSLEQKQRLQRVFFPDGLAYTSQGFGTAPSNSFFNLLRGDSEQKTTLASPTGFEPVLSP